MMDTSERNGFREEVDAPLAERVGRFWEWYVENERELSFLIPPESQADAERLTELVGEGCALISEDLNYNLGGDFEFTFSVEGWPDLFIINPYIISRMPESLKPKWKFYPFNQGTDMPFGFRMFGADIDTGKIMVRASFNEDTERFLVSYHYENLAALPLDDSQSAMWIILENTLGEGVAYKYLDDIEQAAETEEGMIPLPGLRNHIKETLEAHGQKLFENPAEVYTSYYLTTQDTDEPRYDIISGMTRLSAINADYYNDSTEIFDHLQSFGARAVYIAYPNPAGLEGKECLNLRFELEDLITNELLAPAKLGTVIGGATGTRLSYIDLIVYDMPQFLNAITPLLRRYPDIPFSIADLKRHAKLSPLSHALSAGSLDSAEE